LATKRNVVPVILPGFAFPAELPSDIADLARHQAIEYSHTLFEATARKVLIALGAEGTNARRPRLWIATAVGGAGIAAMVAGVLFVRLLVDSNERASITAIPSHPALGSPGAEPAPPARTVSVAAPRDEGHGGGLYKVQYRYQRVDGGFLIDYRVPYLDLVRRGGPVEGIAGQRSPFVLEWPRVLVTVANNEGGQIVITSVVLDIVSSELRNEAIPVIDDGALTSLIIVNQGWGAMIDPKLTFSFLDPAAPAPGAAPAGQEIALSTFTGSQIVQLGKFVPPHLAQLPSVVVRGAIAHGSAGARQTVAFSTSMSLASGFGSPVPPPREEYGIFFKSGAIGRVVADLEAA
jgi:hypothetical protein